MKVLGKIALAFTGCFLVFAILGGVMLSADGGIRASLRQVYDRLEAAWPYEAFDRLEDALNQIDHQIDFHDKDHSGSSQLPAESEDSCQAPVSGVREIDVKAQDCTVEIVPGEPGSQLSAVLDRKTDRKIKLEVFREDDELKIQATKRGWVPSTKRDAVLTVTIPSDYQGDFSFDGEACDANARGIGFSGEIDIELSACNFQGDGLQGTEISISASTSNITLSQVRGKLELDQSLGNTSLTFGEVAGDIEVENSLGNIDLYFPPNSPIQISSASSLGEINRNLLHSGSGQVSGPLYLVEITSSMGSVNLYDAE